MLLPRDIRRSGSFTEGEARGKFRGSREISKGERMDSSLAMSHVLYFTSLRAYQPVSMLSVILPVASDVMTAWGIPTPCLADLDGLYKQHTIHIHSPIASNNFAIFSYIMQSYLKLWESGCVDHVLVMPTSIDI